MLNKKHAIALVLCAASLAASCFALAGCGEQIAATWSNGDIKEADVTTYIENLRTNNSLTDESDWEDYIKNRTYNDDATDEEKKTDGTVADLRTYVINQMIRQDVIEHEVEVQGITVSDEEVDSYVEQQRQMVESMYTEGVFESYLQMVGYEDLEAFKEEAKETVAEQKLEEQVTSSTDSDDENSDDSSDSDDDAWDEYVDGLVAAADVHINDMPTDLSYDPANASSDDGESTEDQEDADSADSSSDDDSSDSEDSSSESGDNK